MKSSRGRTAPVATKHRSDQAKPMRQAGKTDREIPEGPQPIPEDRRTPKDAHKEQMARRPEKRTDYKTLYKLVEDIRERFAQHNQMMWEHLTGILGAVTPPSA